MSAFVSFASTEGCYLLTDGAVWRAGDPRLTEVRRKVWTARTVPVAITSKGHADDGQEAAIEMCDLADRMGVQAFYDHSPHIANSFAERWGVRDGFERVQFHVSVFLPDGIGGAHFGFKSWADGIQYGDPANRSVAKMAPYDLCVCNSPLYYSGTVLDVASFKARGLIYAGDESVERYARRAGLEMMEEMRRKAATTLDGEVGFIVGGQCDFTSITLAGCKTNTLRTWPDKIGEQIDPFK